MAISPTKLPFDHDAILTRECKIEFDGDVSLLTLSFTRPRRTDKRSVEASLRLECKYFDETLTLEGGDDVAVLTFLLGVGRSYLEGMKQSGFTIWWIEKGDFEFFDFWSYQRKPSEFCLQSAYDDAALDAFLKENEGKFLLPSHRVAIEPDRPGITTYRVEEDGTDAVEGLIGPDEIAKWSRRELCTQLGYMILSCSPEGQKLLELAGRNQAHAEGR